ncbi:hypothetical protein MA16_Dca012268 [Dendrobium catenatum]|uniref:Uncharacterized protein n=1 Tax=Dendrobium catenatum TaxID=906689 RepID=A0A2I0WR60_9ASPA|nr:hypothetical protein MA16_Dca012268 [Dendrobium catenatum]
MLNVEKSFERVALHMEKSFERVAKKLSSPTCTSLHLRTYDKNIFFSLWHQWVYIWRDYYVQTLDTVYRPMTNQVQPCHPVLSSTELGTEQYRATIPCSRYRRRRTAQALQHFEGRSVSAHNNFPYTCGSKLCWQQL